MPIKLTRLKELVLNLSRLFIENLFQITFGLFCTKGNSLIVLMLDNIFIPKLNFDYLSLHQ